MPKRRRRSRSWRKLLATVTAALTVLVVVHFSLRREHPVYPVPARSVDVVVIGGGLAGPAAAVFAAGAGADVFYLDVSGPGGSGFPAFSPSFWAAGTSYQQEAGLDYSPEDMALQVMGTGEMPLETALRLSLASAESLSWLEGKTRVAFSRLAEPQTNPGLHLPSAGRAERFVPAALSGQMDLLLAGATRDLWPQALVFDRGRVTGVLVRDRAGNEETVFCRAVIVADGGIGGNPGQVAARGGPAGLSARPDGGHMGTGIELAAGAGALVTGLGTFLPLAVLLPEGRRFNPGLLEAAIYLDSRGNVVAVTGNLPEVVLSSGGRLFAVSGGGTEEEIDFLYFADIHQLSLGLALPPELLAEALQGMEAPYRVAVIGVVGVTTGGIVVDENFRVLAETGPLAGLFAAGEAVAGLPGAGAADFAFAAEIISARLAAAQAVLFARR